MDNIEFLLQSLDAEFAENDDKNFEDRVNTETDSPVESADKVGDNYSVNSTTANIKNDDILHDINESVFKNDYDFAITRKQLSSKYSSSGYEIHKKLKEEKVQHEHRNTKSNSWKSNVTPKAVKELSAPISNTKQDVYAEPIFGLRLLNPLVSSSVIESKMSGKHAVSASNISYHLRCGDKSNDWVFAGAIVFKSGIKTSQKGSQYCLWKISDLKPELKQVTLYLFGKACSELWKISLGTVVAVLNAAPFYNDEKVNNDEVTLTIRNADQVMIWGGSRDYGVCKALKKNGEKCISFVNKSQCEFCIYHLKKEYSKYAGTRASLQAPSIGLTNLRNKVLGKSEVFYAGKSYTAVNVPKRLNNEKKGALYPNSLQAGMSKKLRESDQRKLEKLNTPTSSFTNVTVDSLKLEKSPKVTSNMQTNDQIKPKVTLPTEKCSPSVKSKTETIISLSTKSSSGVSAISRLHLLKQAGTKMLESGEVTRITAATKSKTPCFSFADVLSGEPPSSMFNNTKDTKENENKDKTITLKRSENLIDLSIDVKSVRSSNSTSNSPVVSTNRNKLTASRKNMLTVRYEKKSNNTSSGNVGTSKILQDFKNLTRNETPEECFPKCDVTENNTTKATNVSGFNDNTKIDFTNVDQPINDTSSLKTFMLHQSSPSGSVHDLKKARAKQNAINLIKKRGGIVKTNPNQVRSDPNKRKSLKRPADSSDIEDAEECLEKSVLSQRFVDLMNATSKHENLVQIAEDVERQDYFNKMEKKEQLEEKMLATYKVPCKAVVCLKCKYKWFSASDLCRAEGHPIKVIDTVKRYFKCDNCTNRTISLELVPLTSCKQCGASKWSRAGMIKEKLAKNDNTLSIRGDEIKHLDSLSHSMNINLLVPDDK